MSKLELSIDVLEKNLGKILNQDQLYSLLDHSDWLKKWEKKYKIVYYLRLRGYLFPLKRNLFLVTSPEKKWTEDQILSLYYWEVLVKMGKDLWWNKWYIWGLKALEIRLWDYDIRRKKVWFRIFWSIQIESKLGGKSFCWLILSLQY